MSVRHINFHKPLIITGLIIYSLFISCSADKSEQIVDDTKSSSPKIVNIINFIRHCEPRIDWITEDVLYETFKEQIKIMKKYNLKGSFLLQL